MTADLRINGLTAGYGRTVVLQDVDMIVPEGKVMALLGRNGVGKTTLLESIMGATTRHGGSVSFAGDDLDAMPTERRMRRGICHVPQGRRVFPSLTVDQNIEVSLRLGGWTRERIYDLLPRLAERRNNGGAKLSGGEQQMLAIARALAGGPRLLLLDEPTEGLAPVMVDLILRTLDDIRHAEAVSMILVEHKVALALDFADEVTVLDRGRVTLQGRAAELDPHLLEERVLGSITLGAA